jgi:hypothetical protein
MIWTLEKTNIFYNKKSSTKNNIQLTWCDIFLMIFIDILLIEFESLTTM